MFRWPPQRTSGPFNEEVLPPERPVSHSPLTECFSLDRVFPGEKPRVRFFRHDKRDSHTPLS